jgi:hypothetical protein
MSVSKHVTKGVRQEWEVASSMSGLSTTSKAMAPNCPLWPWVFSVSPAKKSPSICFNSLFIRFSVVFNSHGLKAWFPEGGSANWPSDFERKYPRQSFLQVFEHNTLIFRRHPITLHCLWVYMSFCDMVDSPILPLLFLITAPRDSPNSSMWIIQWITILRQYRVRS